MNSDDPIKLWQHLHGASAHFPIALIIVSFGFDFAAVVFKHPSWRTVAFWTLIVAAGISVASVLTGLAGQIGWFGIEPLLKVNPDSSVLHTFGHRNVSLLGTAVMVGLTAWRVARRDAIHKGEFILYLLLLTLATGAIGYTGYLGAYIAKGY